MHDPSLRLSELTFVLLCVHSIKCWLSQVAQQRRQGGKGPQPDTGILGNEEADKAAKKAAQWPDLCEYTTPAHNPFEGKTWLVYESSPASADRPPKQRAVANLGRGLKHAIRAATKLGFSRRTDYVRYWQESYEDPEGADPTSSNPGPTC